MATTKGTAVSFNDTPQATDDFFSTALTGLTEDNLGTFVLRVMDNDSGGNAKSLYSLDDGINSAGASGDLLQRDIVGGANRSLHGATIKITADGKISFDASTLDASFVADLQHLTAGEFATDSFTYAIQLGNGTLSWATATVQIAGVNDAPVIVSPAPNANVVELANTAGSATADQAAGAISFTDLDLTDAHSAGVVANGSGYLGTFSLDPISQDSTGGGTGSLSWHFSVADGALDFLAAGQQLTQSYSVTVDDGHGSTAKQVVNVTLTGANDAPVLQAPVAADPVLTNDSLTVTDTLAFNDLDLADTHSVTFTPQGSGYIGNFTPVITTDSNGHGSITATYHLTREQFEANGGVFSDHQDYLVTVDDHHGGISSQIVSVPLAQILAGAGGGNDNNSDPVIYINASAHDTATGVVFDDINHPNRQLIIERLSFTDAEASQFHGVSAVGDTPGGTWGTLFASVLRNSDGTVFGSGDPDGFLAASPDGGVIQWSYQVNELGPVQALGAGETHTDQFQLMLTDDSGGFTTQDIVVTIQGQNDAPQLTGAGVSSLYMDGPFSDAPNPFFTPGLHQENSFDYVDPDLHDHHTVSATFDAALSTVAPNANFMVDLPSDTFNGHGMVHWIFQLNDSALPYIPGDEGRPREATYDVKIDDGHGGSVIPFVVTFNSSPTIQGDATSTATFPVSPGETNTWSFLDNFAFDDVDPADQHSVSVGYDYNLMNGQPPLGTLTATMLNDTSNGTGGLVHFDYELTPSAAANLLPGQQKIDAFDIRLDDGHGGFATHTVLVTLNGTQLG
jgi:VCBS repeat-containing protein